MAFETSTARLRLRRPGEQDRAFHDTVHSDPRLYTHAPHVLGTPERNRAFFDAILAHWREHDFGYWVAQDLQTGVPLGWVGVKQNEGYLNLYYRFILEVQGRGLAREAGQAAVAMAAEWQHHDPVRAVVKDHNTPSVRTAESVGLVRTGERLVLGDDGPDEPSSAVFESARVERVGAVDPRTREEVLELWCRVNDAGGAVGFLPGTPRSMVDAALCAHEQQMASGDAVAGALRLPDGELVGWAWWVRGPNPLMHHGRWLHRVMVDPSRQGRGLGLVLMGGMHRIAREDGIELLQLGVRSGSGAGRFSSRCGYVEVGRIPSAIRVGPGDDRDDVTMARRVDGAALRAHGGA